MQRKLLKVQVRVVQPLHGKLAVSSVGEDSTIALRVHRAQGTFTYTRLGWQTDATTTNNASQQYSVGKVVGTNGHYCLSKLRLFFFLALIIIINNK